MTEFLGDAAESVKPSEIAEGVVEVEVMTPGDRLLVALTELRKRGDVKVENIGKNAWSIELDGPAPFNDGMEWNHADLVQAAEALLGEVEDMEAIAANL